jgi:FkbM family methyltransferase
LKAWRFGARTVRRTFGRREFDVYLTDWMADEWYSKGYPELEEIRFLSQHGLRAGSRVFDIGAHQCVVAMMLADAVGPEGQVIAVELDHHNARIGRINVRQNQMANVDIVEAAAAASSGTLPLGYGGKRVRAVSVDELVEQFGRPDVLYIDVDGYEAEVLRGARKTMEQHRPDMFVEVHIGVGLETAGESLESLMREIPEDVYDLWALADVKGAVPAAFRADLPLVKQRFFLLATKRGPDLVRHTDSVRIGQSEGVLT